MILSGSHGVIVSRISPHESFSTTVVNEATEQRGRLGKEQEGRGRDTDPQLSRTEDSGSPCQPGTLPEWGSFWAHYQNPEESLTCRSDNRSRTSENPYTYRRQKETPVTLHPRSHDPRRTTRDGRPPKSGRDPNRRHPTVSTPYGQSPCPTFPTTPGVLTPCTPPLPPPGALPQHTPLP